MGNGDGHSVLDIHSLGLMYVRYVYRSALALVQLLLLGWGGLYLLHGGGGGPFSHHGIASHRRASQSMASQWHIIRRLECSRHSVLVWKQGRVARQLRSNLTGAFSTYVAPASESGCCARMHARPPRTPSQAVCRKPKKSTQTT